MQWRQHLPKSLSLCRGGISRWKLLSTSFILEQKRHLWPSDFQQEAIQTLTHARKSGPTLRGMCPLSPPASALYETHQICILKLESMLWRKIPRAGGKNSNPAVSGPTPTPDGPSGGCGESLTNCLCLHKAKREAKKRDAIPQQTQQQLCLAKWHSTRDYTFYGSFAN